jgi:hypothetical protein
MATDIEEEEGLELPPPPKRVKKTGRPKGRKNNKTLKKERRQKAVNTAMALLEKGAVKRGGKKLVDVAAILHELHFDPLYEAVELFREIEEDRLDPDRRKLMLEIIKFITPFYAHKQKPPEDTATSHNVPVFQIHIGASNYKQPMIDVTPREPVEMPEAEVEEEKS